MADVGWEGVWEPNTVDKGSLNELKDRAGEPQYNKRTGAPYEWCAVNLKTGEYRYPIRFQGIAPD